MNFFPQSIPEVIVIEPKVIADERGFFCETFREDRLEKFLGFRVEFVQDNLSESSRGVLRGLHYQLHPYAQSKLVSVIKGNVLDVAVDIRRGSPNYGKHVAIELSDLNKKQLFIPRGFAHGFVVLSKKAIFSYKVDSYYNPENDRGLAFDDEHLNINWMIPKSELQLSKKDTAQPKFSDLTESFEYNLDYYA